MNNRGGQTVNRETFFLLQSLHTRVRCVPCPSTAPPAAYTTRPSNELQTSIREIKAKCDCHSAAQQEDPTDASNDRQRSFRAGDGLCFTSCRVHKAAAYATLDTQEDPLVEEYSSIYSLRASSSSQCLNSLISRFVSGLFGQLSNFRAFAWKCV